jgi:hypothetical protein
LNKKSKQKRNKQKKNWEKNGSRQDSILEHLDKKSIALPLALCGLVETG